MAEVAARLPDAYRLVTPIARSAMSVVYLADEPALARRVAVKVLAPEVAEEPEFRARFTREVGIAAALDHPNVVPIHAAGESAGLLYLAMRYVEGSDLSALLRDGPLDLDDAVRVLGQVADALDAAHREGLVHRDVKPGNVLLDRRTGHAYLCDFGIATHVAAAGTLTRTGSFVGTADYVAPEQIQGWPVDGRADVYALGAVLYRCLAGSPPFSGEQSAVLWSHVNAPRPSLHAQRPDLPEQLDGVLARAMAKDPAQRYASCGELIDDVRALGSAPARSGRRRAGLVLLAVLAVLAAVVVVPLLLIDRPDAADLDRLPAALRGSCAPGGGGPPGAATVLRCADGAGGEAVVGLYDAVDGSDRAYAQLVEASSIDGASGDCAAATAAEHRYPGVGPATGRVLCHRDGGAATLTWTDRGARIVASAERGDGNDLELYRAWEGWVGVPAFPTVEERELLDLLPEPTCRRAPPSSLDGQAGATVSVDCDPLGSGARTVRYQRFADVDAVRRAFAGRAAAAEVPDGGFCLDEPAGFRANSEYDVRSAMLGRLLCHPDGTGGFRMTWSADALGILGEVVGREPEGLVDWWEFERGPELGPLVDAVNATAAPPFPTEAERALLDRVPAASRVNCARPSATQVQLNVGDVEVVAAVACGTVDGPPIVFHYQFADAAALNRSYGPVPAGPELDCTALPPEFTGEGAYRRPDGTTGRLSCGVNEGGRNFLVWTDDRGTVLGLAFGDDPAVLVDWWQRAAGPV